MPSVAREVDTPERGKARSRKVSKKVSARGKNERAASRHHKRGRRK